MIVYVFVLAVCLFPLPLLSQSSIPDSVSVIITFTPECPICRAYLPRIGMLIKEWETFPVRLTLLVPDALPDVSAVREVVGAAGLQNVSLMFDSLQEYTRQYGLTVTPEAAVVTESGVLVYRGRIDNLYERLGVRRRVVSSFDLLDAVRRLLERGHGPLQTTAAVGCVIERRW